ncbi:MAG TPA: Flp pilus assembly protein CpaB [Labilithrix sp.]|nr:Flp pilus assembly protein CpaB [Labilithrix sp.]
MKAKPVFLGIVAGLVAVGLLLLYLRRVEQEAAGGRKVQVLVALEMIPRGTPITDKMLGARDLPVAYVDDRVVRFTERDKLLGLRATSTIPIQQSLVWNDVMAVKDDQRALSALVQPGNRATPIRVQITDVLTLVHPGDFIDILCVCGEAKEATVLLQRVLVLATGMETSFAVNKEGSQRATVLTVSTSLQESQLLSVAMEKGKLNAIVRNPNDQRITEAPADVTASALTDASRRQAVPGPRRKPTPNGPTELKENRR